jgi:hypothetical protein
MLFAVVPTCVQGRRLSEREIEAARPVAGDLRISQVFDGPGGRVRTFASLSQGAVEVLKPILEPRITGMSPVRFSLRGLEEVHTAHGKSYVLQEWLVEERREGRERESQDSRASAALPRMSQPS